MPPGTREEIFGDRYEDSSERDPDDAVSRRADEPLDGASSGRKGMCRGGSEVVDGVRDRRDAALEAMQDDRPANPYRRRGADQASVESE